MGERLVDGLRSLALLYNFFPQILTPHLATEMFAKATLVRGQAL